VGCYIWYSEEGTRGGYTHVRSNWQSSFEVKRSMVKVTEAEKEGLHIPLAIGAAYRC